MYMLPSSQAKKQTKMSVTQHIEVCILHSPTTETERALLHTGRTLLLCGAVQFSEHFLSLSLINCLIGISSACSSPVPLIVSHVHLQRDGKYVDWIGRMGMEIAGRGTFDANKVNTHFDRCDAMFTCRRYSN